uniref:Prolyl 4-hydroxylase alpha subunit Fe(2+) 2OG dioxygenase domain-containing protein n=1 Tax=Mantoniella antarctica TaxID=81844 RepID=A0A7S0SYB6_9CHLO|mmetsp:Transcript_4276/g.10472  ORF Transcript_4276/g.10472 Transcript_4276/m.10472 type:complete len:339 (+) Transcript_4276:98-1114(+)
MLRARTRSSSEVWSSVSLITAVFVGFLGGVALTYLNPPPAFVFEMKSQYNDTIGSVYTKYFSEERLFRLADEHRERFRNAKPFPHMYLEDFLDPELVKAVNEEFASTDFGTLCEEHGGLKTSSKKKKVHCFYKSTDENESKKSAVLDESVMGPYTRLVFGLLKSSMFVEFLERLSGIENIIPDPHYRGSGLHQTGPGGFLRVHADFNRYARFQLDRRVNVFLFLNEEWDPAWGGALELWPRNMSRCEVKIQPLFNRLVIFRSTDFSYHGYTDPIRSPHPRRSASMYYYTLGRPDDEKIAPQAAGTKSHGTLWQKVKCAMQTDEAISPACGKHGTDDSK